MTIYHDDSADAHDLSGGGVGLTVKSGNCPDVTSPVNVFRYKMRYKLINKLMIFKSYTFVK